MISNKRRSEVDSPIRIVAFIGAAAIAVSGVFALNYIQGLISVVFATSATRI